MTPSARQIQLLSVLASELLDFADWIAGNQLAVPGPEQWLLIKARAQALVEAAKATQARELAEA